MRMHSRKSGNAGWKSILGGLISAGLLLPVPVLAAINFSGVTWTPSQPSFGALFGNITSSSTANDTDITFILNNGQTFAVGKTTVISSAIPAASTDTLKGTWLGLNALNIQGGSLTVSIAVSSGAPNNMFGATYTSTPPAGPAIASSTGFTSNPIVTVTFDYSSTVTVGALRQPSTQFTLDFHN